MVARLSFRAESRNLFFSPGTGSRIIRDVSTSLHMTEGRSAKTCETTSKENRLRGNRSANAADSFHGVAARESRLCRFYRNGLADSG
jgi:hypothetical protein